MDQEPDSVVAMEQEPDAVAVLKMELEPEEPLTLEDWLDDLQVRFLINLPEEDLSDVSRICFQIEEAHWFYEDFIRPLDPRLPTMSLKTFHMRIFQHCILFTDFDEDMAERAYKEFLEYKTRIPVRGAILLNHKMDRAVLVRGWKKNGNWSFPRGKINKDEDDLDCAIREVYEETGFDVRAAGLVPPNNVVKYLEQPMRDQNIRLYVFRGVSENTVFEAQTRKEIGDIRWYALKDLPAYRKKKGARNEDAQEVASRANKFYMVAPFLVKLKSYVVEQKKQDSREAKNGAHVPTVAEEDLEEEIPDTSDEVTPRAHRANATAELHRLLNIQPTSADSSQVPTPTPAPAPQPNPHDAVASALMSLLKPEGAPAPPNGHSHPHPTDHYNPQTPQDLGYTNVSQSQTPATHYQQHTQPVPYTANPELQQQAHQYQNMPATMPRGQQQNWHWKSDVAVVTGPDDTRRLKMAGRQYPNEPAQPVPLQHPQPQHPQVQQAQLMRGMAATPDQPGPSGPPSTAHADMTNQDARMAPSGPGTSANSDALFAKLFKSGNGPAVPENHSLITPARDQAAANPKPMPPQGEHQTKLLSMFMGGATPVQNETAAEKPLTTNEPTNEPISTADAIRAVAKETGGPVVMNPELNLPFGALSIATRPQSQKAPAAAVHEPSPSLAPSNAEKAGPAALTMGQLFKQSKNEARREAREAAAASRGSSRASKARSAKRELYKPEKTPGSEPSPRVSPSGHAQLPFYDQLEGNKTGPRPIPQPKTQSQHNASFACYPYRGGSLTQNSNLSALVMNQAVPAASALPMPTIPNVLKPRPENTQQQKDQLLALFGQGKTDQPASQPQSRPSTKGKEPATSVAGNGMSGMAAMAGTIGLARPRSRIASIVSGYGNRSPSSHTEYGDSNKAPLSPADQDFLHRFLADASKNAMK